MRNIRNRRREGRAAQVSTEVDSGNYFEQAVVHDAHADNMHEHSDRGRVSNIQDNDGSATNPA